MKGSEFLFDYVHLLYYECHEINRNIDGYRFSLLDKNKKIQQIPSTKRITNTSTRCNSCVNL